MIYKDDELLNLKNVKGKPIAGITIKPLKKIPDNRGAIYHMLRSDDEVFEKFGEIYFSTIHPGIVKGWHIHEKMTLNYALVVGAIKLVLYDERKNSPTKGNLLEIFLDEENYQLVTIPPHIWNGFTNKGKKTSIVANCATLPHDSEEISRIDPNDERINYKW